jgi:hypothetical protein
MQRVTSVAVILTLVLAGSALGDPGEGGTKKEVKD